MKSRNVWFVISILILLFGAISLLLLNQNEESQENDSSEIPKTLQNSNIRADYSNSSIPLEEILSGGPGKDGIPALTDPEFVSISESRIDNETQVIVVQKDEDVRIYPLSILVWHEIVNDVVGGEPLVITFCPLCGSSIVYEARVEGEVTEFGVSGLLYESNLLMYDRNDSESLWSQSRGEAVVGIKTGRELVYYPFELLDYKKAVDNYPDAIVLSENTGYTRDYSSNPYAGYEDNENTLFPVSVKDNSFPAKEVFYIVALEGLSVAVRLDKEDGIYELPNSNIVVQIEKGQPKAFWGEQEIPGYYEMWFSWATNNRESGEVL